MVGGALARVSVFRVGSGVGGAVIAPGLRACPSHLCDGWVCGLGAVGASLVFGLVRGAGAFAAVLPSFVLVPPFPRQPFSGLAGGLARGTGLHIVSENASLQRKKCMLWTDNVTLLGPDFKRLCF